MTVTPPYYAIVLGIVVAFVVYVWARVSCPSCPECPSRPECPPCAECPTGYAPLAGYVYTRGAEGVGGTLDSANQSPAGLKEMCDASPNCRGFSFNGIGHGVLYDSDEHAPSTNPLLTYSTDTGFYAKQL